MSFEPEKVPPSFQISRQLDQEKITFLTKRIEELLRSNNDLRSGASQNEKDTHDIVLYFQREMEIKDDIILRLNEELVKCQTQLKFEVERIKKQYESELQELKLTSEHTITNLQTKLTSLEADLKAVEVYKREKDLHEEAVKKLEKNMQQQREQLIDAMEEQERRFLEEKSQIFKELDEQKAAFREVALNEARLAMSEEAKKILADNNRMFEELKFHHAEAVQFQAEKAVMTTELTTAKRELSLLAEKEIEYAKQAHNRSKEIKALRERVEQLEKQQATNIEKFKTRAKELKATVTKELEEATLDATGLRRLLNIKNKELKHMKSLAATILAQREETEQFFLESLQEVKEVIRQERKREQQQIQQQQPNNAKRMNNTTGFGGTGGGGTTFPPLNIKQSNMHLMEPRRTKPTEIQLGSLEKVTISDLTWEDKELVLRVLFAKMNGASGKAPKVTNLGPKRFANTNPEAVFISEGANLPDHHQMSNALGYFEVRQGDETPKSVPSSYSYDLNQANGSGDEGEDFNQSKSLTGAGVVTFQDDYEYPQPSPSFDSGMNI